MSGPTPRSGERFGDGIDYGANRTARAEAGPSGGVRGVSGGRVGVRFRCWAGCS
jgi:hypothetical protein